MWVANAITLHAALHHWQILIYVSLDQPALVFTGIMNVKRNRLGVPPSLQTGGQRIEVCGGEQMKGGSPLMGGQIKWKMREEKRRGWDTQRPALGHSPLAWLGGNATAVSTEPFHALPLLLWTNKAQLRQPCHGSSSRHSESPANSLSAHQNVPVRAPSNARPGLCLQTKNLWK